MGFGFGGASQARTKESMERQAPKKQRRYTFGSHANTAHVWAQQGDETYCGQSSDGRITFDGPTIYSYGPHFPMAHFVGTHGVARVVLVNSDTYSTSTGKHKSEVQGALSGLDVVQIPAGTEFIKTASLDYTLGADDIRKTHDSLLESIAYETQRAHNESESNTKASNSDWQSDYHAGRLAEDRAALEAFRALFKVRLAVPADVVAWSKARHAEAKRKAVAAKVNDARKFAKQVIGWQLPEQYRAPTADASSYQIESRARDLKSHASRLYSARQTLAKAKATPRLIKACSKAIKTLTEARETWRAVFDAAKANELHATDMERLAEVRDYITAGTVGGHEPKAFWNYETTGRLWAVAIRENMPDVAEALAREVQVTMWLREVPDTFKAYDYQSQRDRVTLDQWMNGKGNASQYGDGFESTQVRRKGDVLQTSRGADCPFSHAVLAFKQAQRCRASGQTWHSNGHKIKVGYYGVDSIDATGTLKAGCHVIPFDSMLALAVREIPADVAPSYPLPAVIG